MLTATHQTPRPAHKQKHLEQILALYESHESPVPYWFGGFYTVGNVGSGMFGTYSTYRSQLVVPVLKCTSPELLHGHVLVQYNKITSRTLPNTLEEPKHKK